MRDLSFPPAPVAGFIRAALPDPGWNSVACLSVQQVLKTLSNPAEDLGPHVSGCSRLAPRVKKAPPDGTAAVAR